MDLIQIILLAIVQGLSEFLPISSSAHLILLSQLNHWSDQGLLFDVTVHFATLVAVIMYFRKDIFQLISDGYCAAKSKKTQGQSTMAWGIVIATIPVGLVGLLAKDWIELNLRSIEVIAYSTAFFALLLALADFLNRRYQQLRQTLNYFDVCIIGLAQALALIPGTSRAGITITAALLLGLSRKRAAQFSFLLAIPVIGLSTLLLLFDLSNQTLTVDWFGYGLAFIISASIAYLTIGWFMRFIEKVGLLPFVIYRIVLACVLFIMM